MDFSDASSFSFKDEDWVSKAIIGSFIALLAFPFPFISTPIL